MRKLCRNHYNSTMLIAICFRSGNFFSSTYSVFNPSYSFSETDALAQSLLGNLSTHVVKKKAHLLILSLSQMGTKNIDCFVLFLKYDKLGPYPEFGNYRF